MKSFFFTIKNSTKNMVEVISALTPLLSWLKTNTETKFYIYRSWDMKWGAEWRDTKTKRLAMVHHHHSLTQRLTPQFCLATGNFLIRALPWDTFQLVFTCLTTNFSCCCCMWTFHNDKLMFAECLITCCDDNDVGEFYVLQSIDNHQTKVMI